MQRGNNTTAISSILESKDVSSRNIYGDTPLLWAARRGDPTFVSQVISMGADVNDVNEVTGETPLIAAAKKGHVDVVMILLNSGANRNAKDRLGQDALTAAISAANVDVLRALIKEGFSIDQSKTGPLLLLASNSGDAGVVEHLLQSGAPVEYRGADGETPLMAAVKSGKPGPVELLLKSGAKVESVDSAGRTPLILAAQSGRLDTCETLVSAGANVNARDGRGNTPLMWAILSGRQDVALTLIKKGTDVSVRNAANKNALYLSAFEPETARSLLEKDARLVEAAVEDTNRYRSAMAYQWLAGFIEEELSRGRADPAKAIPDVRLAYEIAGRQFESAVNQFSDLASDIRTKQVTQTVIAVLATAASFATGAIQAQQQAHRMAEISALQSRAGGGSGVGRGYGSAPFFVATPNNAPLAKSAEEFDDLARDAGERAKSCKAKAECYRTVGAGQERQCFSK